MQDHDDYPRWVWLAVGILVAAWIAVGAWCWWRNI